METQEPQGRVNPTDQGPVNPAAYFAEWNSTEQCFSYYDKKEKKTVLLPLPFTFLPLHRGVCVKGYSDPENTSYISNEVKNTNTDIMCVRAYNNVTKKSSVYCSGLWNDIKDTVKLKLGGKTGWSESFYSAVKNPTTKKLELINVQLNGSGLTHWRDFIKSNDIWSNAVHVKEFTNEKKGVNKYFAPKFTCVKIKKETDIEAAVLQKEIIAFLTAYYAKNKAELGGQSATTSAPAATNKSQEAAFNADKHPQAQHSEFIEEGSDIIRGMEMPDGEDF